MPNIDWNKNVWNYEYNWEQHGEEWSHKWGSSDNQWFGSLYPRLHQFLPQKMILEIAPGFGRWSKYLIPCCKTYIGVDISETCINFCKKFFSKGKFIVNDGLSLKMIKDNSINFCFSFDSLVHADWNIVQLYLEQIMQKLTSDGVAFIHHSNFLEYHTKIENIHYRAEDVSSKKVCEFLLEKGATYIIQENINWGGENCSSDFIDTLTTFSKNPKYNKFISFENNRFMQEASICKDIFSYYNK